MPPQEAIQVHLGLERQFRVSQIARRLGRGGGVDYTPSVVASALRHWDAVDADTRADLARCLIQLPHNDEQLLRLYGMGYSPTQALNMLGQRGDPHKRLRSALTRLVAVLEGMGNGTDRTDRRTLLREDNRSA